MGFLATVLRGSVDEHPTVSAVRASLEDVRGSLRENRQMIRSTIHMSERLEHEVRDTGDLAFGALHDPEAG